MEQGRRKKEMKREGRGGGTKTNKCDELNRHMYSYAILEVTILCVKILKLTKQM